MSWNKDFKQEEIVADLTKPLGKIWDNLLPLTFPYVVNFRTNSVVEVKQKKYAGPLYMDEHFIHYNCLLTIDKQPLIDVGWDGGEISPGLVKRAYGELYFHELRGKLASLTSYLGNRFSSFDSGGDIEVELN